MSEPGVAGGPITLPRPDEPATPIEQVQQAALALPVRPLAIDRSGIGQAAAATNRVLRRRLQSGDGLALVAAGLFGSLRAPGGATARSLLAEAGGLAVALVAMHLAGLYRARRCALHTSEAARVAVAVTAGVAVLPAVDPSHLGSAPGTLLEQALFSSVFILLLRWRFGRWLRARRSQGQFLRKVILVGSNDDAAAIWTMLENEPELGYRVGAVFGPARADGPWPADDVALESEDLAALAARVGANGVIVVSGALDTDALRAAIDRAQAARLHVQVWPGLVGLTSWRVRMAPVSDVPVLYVEPQRVTPWQRLAKRLVDVMLACSLLVLASPVLLAAAISVKLGDRGPVLFRSARVGRGGRLFTVLKFRTMVPDAEHLVATLDTLNERTDGPLFKASRDPRVTSVGRILRATSIDELPQLWNVLNGTMSLVGPRPALPAEVEQFDAELARRHTMRPGITGLWQIEARDNPSFTVYRRLDLVYVDNWHLTLDFSILATTAREVSIRALGSLLRPSRSTSLD